MKRCFVNFSLFEQGNPYHQPKYRFPPRIFPIIWGEMPVVQSNLLQRSFWKIHEQQCGGTLLKSWKSWKVEDEEWPDINFPLIKSTKAWIWISFRSKNMKRFFCHFFIVSKVIPITNSHTDSHPCIRFLHPCMRSGQASRNCLANVRPIARSNFDK